MLIFSLEKQSYWQLLIIKISIATTFSGLVVSQGTVPCGRTWFHSGPPTTLSKKQNPLKLCLSINFLLRHITPDPMSNPVIYYLKWVVSETVGGFNAGETEVRGNRIAMKQVFNRKVQKILPKLWLFAY